MSLFIYFNNPGVVVSCKKQAIKNLIHCNAILANSFNLIIINLLLSIPCMFDIQKNTGTQILFVFWAFIGMVHL